MSEIPNDNEVTNQAESPKAEPLPEETAAVMPEAQPVPPVETLESNSELETSGAEATAPAEVAVTEVSDQPPAENTAPAEPVVVQSDDTSGESNGAAETVTVQVAPEEAVPSNALVTAESMPLNQVIEALLFSTDTPLSVGKLAEVCGLDTTKPVKEVIELLNKSYEERQAAYRIEERAGGYQLLTLPQYADYIYRLVRKKDEGKLTPASLETLAIIAYKQPIIRADVEAIRGVACGEMLRTLMEHNLVKIVGRAEVIGRPMLYGTTRYFLEVFGLANLKDLPKADQLKEPK